MTRWIVLLFLGALVFITTRSNAEIPMEEEILVHGDAKILFDGGLGADQIAITFGGPIVPEFTEEVLHILKTYKLRAHFFVPGLSAMAHPLVVEKIIKQGHVLASGGYGQKLINEEDTSFDAVSQKVETEITLGHEMVYVTGGIIYPFIRFPAHRDTRAARKLIDGNNIFAFYWNIDYQAEDPAGSIKAALDREGNRGIVSISMGRHDSAEALISLIEEIQNRGLTVIAFAPPEGMNWRKNPPLVRNQILNALEKKGSVLKQIHSDIEI